MKKLIFILLLIICCSIHTSNTEATPPLEAGATWRQVTYGTLGMTLSAVPYLYMLEKNRKNPIEGQTGAELEVKILGQGKDYSVEILMHPDETFNGVYNVQAELINERPWYQNDSERYLYFYNQAEGGEKSWSLDHRKPDGSKDWFSGGFTLPTGETILNLVFIVGKRFRVLQYRIDLSLKTQLSWGVVC